MLIYPKLRQRKTHVHPTGVTRESMIMHTTCYAGQYMPAKLPQCGLQHAEWVSQTAKVHAHLKQHVAGLGTGWGRLLRGAHPRWICTGTSLTLS